MHGFFRVVLLRIVVVLLWAHAAPGWAVAPAAGNTVADHVIERQVFHDATGKMAFEEVLNAPFRPAQDVHAGGYTTDVIWMRLVVRPAANGGALVLRVLPTYLNEFVL